MSAANITTDKGNICDSRSSMVYYLFLLFFFPGEVLGGDAVYPFQCYTPAKISNKLCAPDWVLSSAG